MCSNIARIFAVSGVIGSFSGATRRIICASQRQRGGGGQPGHQGRELVRVEAGRGDAEGAELEEWRLRPGEAQAQGAEGETDLTHKLSVS